MLPKSKNSAQSSFILGFEVQLNAEHPLYILANTIDCPVFENAFRSITSAIWASLLSPYYVRNLSDESVAEQWAENSYHQYFSVEHSFLPGIPGVPTKPVDQRTGIIVGAYNFIHTLHDSKTAPYTLEQYERLTGIEAAEVFADRGYRGITTCKIQ